MTNSEIDSAIRESKKRVDWLVQENEIEEAANPVYYLVSALITIFLLIALGAYVFGYPDIAERSFHVFIGFFVIFKIKHFSVEREKAKKKKEFFQRTT